MTLFDDIGVGNWVQEKISKVVSLSDRFCCVDKVKERDPVLQTF